MKSYWAGIVQGKTISLYGVVKIINEVCIWVHYGVIWLQNRVSTILDHLVFKRGLGRVLKNLCFEYVGKTKD